MTKQDIEQYREQVEILISAGFFKLQSGKIEINIHNNMIQNIHVHEMRYKRESKNDRIPI